MPRAINSVASRRRRKKILNQTKGYFGARKNVFKVAINALEKGLQYAYRDRKIKKRTFRGLWIQRINAATREYGMSYSEFIGKVNKMGIKLNRKTLADLAMNHPQTFRAVVESANSTEIPDRTEVPASDFTKVSADKSEDRSPDKIETKPEPIKAEVETKVPAKAEKTPETKKAKTAPKATKATAKTRTTDIADKKPARPGTIRDATTSTKTATKTTAKTKAPAKAEKTSNTASTTKKAIKTTKTAAKTPAKSTGVSSKGKSSVKADKTPKTSKK